MIDHDELTGLMALDAESYDVPPDGPRRVLDAAIGTHLPGLDGDAAPADRAPTAGTRPPPNPQAGGGRPGVQGGPTARARRAKRRRPLVLAAGVAAALLVVAAVAGTAGQLGRDGGDSASTGFDEAQSGDSGAGTGDRAPEVTVTMAPGSGDQESAEKDAGGGGVAGAPGSGTGAERILPAVGQDGAKIIKTGAVEIEVGEGRFSTTLERVTALAAANGGYVAEQQTTELGDAPSGTVTLRVPADRFEEVVNQVRRLGKVLSASSGGRDVTAEYADVDAQLKNLTATRDQLRTVLGEARAIPDILSVQDRINAVQLEIDRLQGQKNLLDDQTAFATLTVPVREAGAEDPITPVDQRSGLGGAWDDAVDGFTGGIERIIAGSGSALVLVLSIAALVLVGRVAWQVTRRRLV
jgi:hypothetical protein